MFPAVQFKTLRKDRFVMCVPTEIRDSATTLGKLRQVVRKDRGLHYIEDGSLKIANDLDDRPIFVPRGAPVPDHVAEHATAKLLHTDGICFFTRSISNN